MRAMGGDHESLRPEYSPESNTFHHRMYKKIQSYPMNRKWYCLLLIAGLTGTVYAQHTAEEALLLTGKSRYGDEVKAFYARHPMDTSSTFVHHLKGDEGLSLALNPLDGYKTIFQVNLSKAYKGEVPLGLSWGLSEAAAAVRTSTSLIVSPAHLQQLKQTQSLVIKGGLAILLQFQDHALSSIYSIGATESWTTLAAWQASPYSHLREGCLSGDCQEGISAQASGKNVHVGQFQNGKRHGYVQSFFDNGDFFHGSYADNIRTQGVYFFHKGHRFSGKFNSNGGTFQGIIHYPNGDKFEGENNAGIPVKGKMTYAQSGNTFNGLFKPDGTYQDGTYFIQGEGSFTGTFQANNKPLTGTLTPLHGSPVRIVDGMKQ